ncbi:hypothetical protein Pst134EB_020358 [Puccinia striiformis f. sp. tritici]|nr:hypothetical protein Pst134EB_020358 [Puccinia striiformis f. sp. tritici]
MVIIEGKKFACEACIKGHRSSNCSHTDRTLVEIGKKGRPPTQCAHCRELRKTSRVHSKCMCGDKPTQSTPRLRVLPNGTSGFLEQEEADTIKLVKQSPNPCSCSTGGKCCCAAPAHPTLGTRARNSKRKASESINTPSLPESSVEEQPVNGALPIPLTSRASCCAGSTPTIEPTINVNSHSGPSRSISSTVTSSFHPYLPANLNNHTLLLPSSCCSTSPNVSNPSTNTSTFNSTTSTQSHTSFIEDFSFSSEQPALFAPRTAGTALCFCGIHCPCPGCILHDPLGLKFQSGTETQCSTSMRNSEGCIAGLDLPTVNGLLNLSPISDSFPKLGSSIITSTTTTEPGIFSQHQVSETSPIQIPGVNETFGIPPPSTSACTTSITTSSALNELGQRYDSAPEDHYFLQARQSNSDIKSCCDNGHTNLDPLLSTNNQTGCCGGLNSLSHGDQQPQQQVQESHESQGLVSGCCEPNPSQSNQEPSSMMTRSCSSSSQTNNVSDLPQQSLQCPDPNQNRNFSSSTTSNDPMGFLNNNNHVDVIEIPSLSFNHVDLI